jgi:hypothetical protein
LILPWRISGGRPRRANDAAWGTAAARQLASSLTPRSDDAKAVSGRVGGLASVRRFIIYGLLLDRNQQLADERLAHKRMIRIFLAADGRAWFNVQRSGRSI